jgi:hypothetical protein
MNRAWLLAAMLLLCGAARAEQDAALEVVAACRARLDPVTDVGIERISRRGPELLPALQGAPWRDLLPRELRARREDLTADSLAALMELVKLAKQETRLREAPRRADLDSILAELGAPGKQGATRWERFKRWLKQKFEDREDDDDAGWLERLSRQFRTSEGVARAITYVGYALVIALVLYVIWSELRALGLLGGVRRASRRASSAAEWRRRLLLADVFDAPLAERPGMLLRLLGEALSRAQRLPAPEGLTAAELARRARLESDADRAELARVAATAEQVRYAAQPPPEEAIENSVDRARELLGKFARLPAERR